MQRVYEIQSNWDEREKLRHFAISRPPVVPPFPLRNQGMKPHHEGRSIYNVVDDQVSLQNMKSQNDATSPSFKQKISSDKHLSEMIMKRVQEKLAPVKMKLDNELKTTLQELNKIKEYKQKNSIIDEILMLYKQKNKDTKIDLLKKVLK